MTLVDSFNVSGDLLPRALPGHISLNIIGGNTMAPLAIVSGRDALQFKDTDFERQDERPDKLFYATDRFVSHLDSVALATVERLIGSLIVEPAPELLDLMASVDSHLPAALRPARALGLGLNAHELEANPRLTETCVLDINEDTRLPYPDETFDVVLNTVSVDYLVQPIAVFKEVSRVLKKGGLFLVIFSNRYFETKVTKVWRQASESERIVLVEEWFRLSGGFGPTRSFASTGHPRPPTDKYASLGIPSDPVYAVFAEKPGGDPSRGARPLPVIGAAASPDPALFAQRRQQMKETLRCPHCDERMLKWAVPQTPFTEWDAEFMYVCFNDSCPYLIAGWEDMARQGNTGASCRVMYHLERDVLFPVAVMSLKMMRDGIVPE